VWASRKSENIFSTFNGKRAVYVDMLRVECKFPFTPSKSLPPELADCLTTDEWRVIRRHLPRVGGAHVGKRVGVTLGVPAHCICVITDDGVTRVRVLTYAATAAPQINRHSTNTALCITRF
jgi:hypothetical protein